MEKIKVLQIIRSMNIGGAQTLLMNILKNIDKEKIEFHFLLNEKGVFDEEIKRMGGKIFYMPYITEVGQMKYCKNLKKFFEEHPEYKIVHSHLNQVSGIILKVAKKCKVPVRISHSHNTQNTNNIIVKLYKLYLQSMINKNATNYFACSKEAAEWLFRNKSKEAIIINNGIEVEKFAFSNEIRERIRKEYNINQGTLVIGHVGRFTEQKNHTLLFKIFSEIYKNRKDSLLFLVGDGKLRKECEEKIKELNLSKNVIFAGEKQNVNEIFNAFDIYVLPSKSEGLGIVLIEAQANGLRCVASNEVPSITNVTGEVTYISLETPIKEWAKVIEEKARLGRIEKIEGIKENGYDIKDTARKLEKIYRELINKKERKN